MFVAVGSAAVALGLFVSWIDGQQHVPKGIVGATHVLEYGLFGADATLFAIFIVRSTWLHAREMLVASLDSETGAPSAEGPHV